MRVRVHKLEGKIVEADGPVRIAPLIFHDFILEMCVRRLAQHSLGFVNLPFILIPRPLLRETIKEVELVKKLLLDNGLLHFRGFA